MSKGELFRLINEYFLCHVVRNPTCDWAVYGFTFWQNVLLCNKKVLCISS